MKYNKVRDEGKCGIYLIRNKTNNKVYIGKSVNIYRRIKCHVTQLNTRDKNENIHLINSWHKYGRDNFEYEVLEYLPKEDDIMKKRELYWMEFYNSLNSEYGYNLRKDSADRCHVKEETRDRLSLAGVMNFLNNPESIEKARLKNIGKPTSKETISKIRNSRRKFDILQFDYDGNFVKRWEDIHGILEENPDYRPQNIVSSCNGYKGRHRGYTWRYWDRNNTKTPSNLQEVPIVKCTIYEPKKVYMFDSEFNFIQTYDSCSDCAKDNDKFNHRSVVNTVGGEKRTFFYRGYYLYGEDNLPDNLRDLVK